MRYENSPTLSTKMVFCARVHPYLISAWKRVSQTFAKTDSLSLVFRPALTYRKTSLSPYFSDNGHILFKVEALGGLTKKKQGASHANLQTHVHTHTHTHENCGKLCDDNRNICPRN